jgi:hypothetical protein
MGIAWRVRNEGRCFWKKSLEGKKFIYVWRKQATSSEQRAGKRGRHASLAPPGTNQQYHYHQHQPVPTLGQRPSPAPAPAPAPTLINRNRPICNTREDCRWPPLRAQPCLPSPDDPIPSQQREAKPYYPASQPHCQPPAQIIVIVSILDSPLLARLPPRV